jgi:F-type H+-transporting ATPase subunit alpha
MMETQKEAQRLPVTLTYVTPPTEEQLTRIRAMIAKRYQLEDVTIALEQDSSLGSGFRLQVGSQQFDWSEAGRLAQLRERLEGLTLSKQESLISLLKTEIANFDLAAKERETGVVLTTADGIATVSGIEHAAYGEIVTFETGTKGMVQELRPGETGVILFGNDNDIREGTRLMRTGQSAGVSVGRGYLGRIVNGLGEPIDGGAPIQGEGYYPVESQAPGIVDRKSVDTPLETGILAIDAMFPIGRGQRELIIGDRQTGKTALALDTILNQKGKKVICIYVAIGQKASTVARIVNTLKQHDAMDYSIVVAAMASDPAPLQYIAPYAGTALGEYFMRRGQDVLMVYDDLSKHAVAYRTMSLLLGRSPGREAYPGDVFYLHSRLLERSARLSPELGGGSITSLPIIETQAGDVSAYIPTNVISITDGQIFLESDLFFAGQRPAVNVGLSVSRVGGAAQTKAMKKAAGSLRVDLAQYREMEVFTQFSSDLDEMTRQQLTYGAGLMELLKQPLYHPLTMAEQVITLVAALNQAFLPIPKKEIKTAQAGLLAWFHQEQQPIVRELETGKTLSEELKYRIAQQVKVYFSTVLPTQQ